MNNLLKILSLFVLTLIMFNCGRKAFPDDQFVFSQKFRNLIEGYRIGDTLKFVNPTLGIRKIKITGMDSIMANSKGGLMSQRPYKLIRLYCEAFDYNRRNAKDTTFIFINKYPDTMEESAHFSLMNFRGWLENEHDSIIAKFQPTSDKTFTNCYVVNNNAPDLVQSDDDIERIYVQPDYGVVALKSYHGDFWIKKD